MDKNSSRCEVATLFNYAIGQVPLCLFDGEVVVALQCEILAFIPVACSCSRRLLHLIVYSALTSLKESTRKMNCWRPHASVTRFVLVLC